MPEARMAQIAWLLVDGVLISPFPTRKGGPTAGETIAIKAMQRRLMRSGSSPSEPRQGFMERSTVASGQTLRTP
jgi:hypothetical protein